MDNSEFRCHLCNVSCSSASNLRQHEEGQRHRKELSRSLQKESQTQDTLKVLRLKQTSPVLSGAGYQRVKVDHSSNHWSPIVCRENYQDSNDCFPDSQSNWFQPEKISKCNISSCDLESNSEIQCSNLAGICKGSVECSPTLSTTFTNQSPNHEMNQKNTSSLFQECDICHLAIFASCREDHYSSDYHMKKLIKKNTPEHLRHFTRSCREHLMPVWRSVTFKPLEVDVLQKVSESEGDSLVRIDSEEGVYKVGIHLAVGLLLANICSMSPTHHTNTCVIWLLSNSSSVPNSKLFLDCKICPDKNNMMSERLLRVAYSPFDLKNGCNYDLIFTDPEYFIKNVAEEISKQNSVCALLIQDPDIIDRFSSIARFLYFYFEKYNVEERLRIICFCTEKVSKHHLFSLFPLITGSN